MFYTTMSDFETPDQLAKGEATELKKKLAVVLGLGEIGRPIFEMLRDAHGEDQVYGKDVEPAPWAHQFKFMHVCIPQSPGFVPALKNYVAEYNPQHIIIHSTLSPGISSYLDSIFDATVYYSPVRGNLKDGMRWSLERYSKYLASWTYVDDSLSVVKHLSDAGFPVEVVNDPVALEWAKILDLAWYGLNIGFYQEIERLSENENFNYTVVSNFIKTTPEQSEGRAARTMFFGGYIGGHCVIPAIEKILAHTDIPMLRAVIDSNIKRQEELLLNKPTHHPVPRRPNE